MPLRRGDGGGGEVKVRVRRIVGPEVMRPRPAAGAGSRETRARGPRVRTTPCGTIRSPWKPDPRAVSQNSGLIDSLGGLARGSWWAVGSAFIQSTLHAGLR